MHIGLYALSQGLSVCPIVCLLVCVYDCLQLFVSLNIHKYMNEYGSVGNSIRVKSQTIPQHSTIYLPLSANACTQPTFKNTRRNRNIKLYYIYEDIDDKWMVDAAWKCRLNDRKHESRQTASDNSRIPWSIKLVVHASKKDLLCQISILLLIDSNCYGNDSYHQTHGCARSLWNNLENRQMLHLFFLLITPWE